MFHFNKKEKNDEVKSRIKILGGGCLKCQQLEKATVDALKELDMVSDIEHVKDFEKIASYGVMSTPALVVDDQVLSYGKVLNKKEVVDLLEGMKIDESK